MKVGIIGSGISGLICAYLLRHKFDVTLYESDDKPGGHVNTVEVISGGDTHKIDTGFIVFNESNYPNFIRLLENLEVESKKTRMGFSVRCANSGLEYSGESLQGLFGATQNLTDLKHWGMVRDIFRFHSIAKRNLRNQSSVNDFLAKHRFSQRFRDAFVLPLGSALWSCSTESFGRFPVEFLFDFLSNHKMLQSFDRPIWRVLKGGSRTYVDKMVKGIGDRLHLNTPVKKVERTKSGVDLDLPNGTVATFDEVILACHADQSLRLLDQPMREERKLLEAFPYEQNLVSLHSDDSLLPRRNSARASWNAYLPEGHSGKATVTYDMNILQGLSCSKPFCVSLNQEERIQTNLHHGDFRFSHPTYHKGRKDAQNRHREFIRNRGISLCGAYWGYGFHEDGISSGLRVCEAFGEKLP